MLRRGNAFFMAVAEHPGQPDARSQPETRLSHVASALVPGKRGRLEQSSSLHRNLGLDMSMDYTQKKYAPGRLMDQEHILCSRVPDQGWDRGGAKMFTQVAYWYHRLVPAGLSQRAYVSSGM